jgi:hypothetical protein
MAASAAADGNSIDHEAVIKLTALENRLFRLQRKSSDAAPGVAAKLVQMVGMIAVSTANESAVCSCDPRWRLHTTQRVLVARRWLRDRCKKPSLRSLRRIFATMPSVFAG